jgi:CheY-like chemotaxis protein
MYGNVRGQEALKLSLAPVSQVNIKVSKVLCILVVEDEWMVRDYIASQLRDQGHVVVEAATGEEAIALLAAETQRIDVLFTDIHLGGRLSGWDVAEAFRTTRPQIQVIYASGRPPETTRRVSGSMFLSKPYLADEILGAVTSCAA